MEKIRELAKVFNKSLDYIENEEKQIELITMWNEIITDIEENYINLKNKIG